MRLYITGYVVISCMYMRMCFTDIVVFIFIYLCAING